MIIKVIFIAKIATCKKENTERITAKLIEVDSKELSNNSDNCYWLNKLYDSSESKQLTYSREEVDNLIKNEGVKVYKYSIMTAPTLGYDRRAIMSFRPSRELEVIDRKIDDKGKYVYLLRDKEYNTKEVPVDTLKDRIRGYNWICTGVKLTKDNRLILASEDEDCTEQPKANTEKKRVYANDEGILDFDEYLSQNIMSDSDFAHLAKIYTCKLLAKAMNENLDIRGNSNYLEDAIEVHEKECSGEQNRMFISKVNEQYNNICCDGVTATVITMFSTKTRNCGIRMISKFTPDVPDYIRDLWDDAPEDGRITLFSADHQLTNDENFNDNTFDNEIDNCREQLGTKKVAFLSNDIIRKSNYTLEEISRDALKELMWEIFSIRDTPDLIVDSKVKVLKDKDHISIVWKGSYGDIKYYSCKNPDKGDRLNYINSLINEETALILENVTVMLGISIPTGAMAIKCTVENNGQEETLISTNITDTRFRDTLAKRIAKFNRSNVLEVNRLLIPYIEGQDIESIKYLLPLYYRGISVISDTDEYVDALQAWLDAFNIKLFGDTLAVNDFNLKDTEINEYNVHSGELTKLIKVQDKATSKILKVQIFGANIFNCIYFIDDITNRIERIDLFNRDHYMESLPIEDDDTSGLDAHESIIRKSESNVRRSKMVLSKTFYDNKYKLVEIEGEKYKYDSDYAEFGLKMIKAAYGLNPEDFTDDDKFTVIVEDENSDLGTRSGYYVYASQKVAIIQRDEQQSLKECYPAVWVSDLDIDIRSLSDDDIKIGVFYKESEWETAKCNAKITINGIQLFGFFRKADNSDAIWARNEDKSIKAVIENTDFGGIYKAHNYEHTYPFTNILGAKQHIVIRRNNSIKPIETSEDSRYELVQKLYLALAVTMTNIKSKPMSFDNFVKYLDAENVQHLKDESGALAIGFRTDNKFEYRLTKSHYRLGYIHYTGGTIGIYITTYTDKKDIEFKITVFEHDDDVLGPLSMCNIPGIFDLTTNDILLEDITDEKRFKVSKVLVKGNVPLPLIGSPESFGYDKICYKLYKEVYSYIRKHNDANEFCNGIIQGSTLNFDYDSCSIL